MSEMAMHQSNEHRGESSGAAYGPHGRPLRVAIVHYWIVSAGGGEMVVKAMLELFPDADIFTLIEDRAISRKLFPGTRVTSSFLRYIPFARHLHRKLLTVMPLALENLDLTGYDLIISSESGPAKGVLPPLGAVHICYSHSPMRYIWDQFFEYRRNAGLLGRWVMSGSIVRLRLWDLASSARVDHFVANSRHVQRRIAKYYRRDAEVIHPPVDVEEFGISGASGEYYLITGRHVPYKRIDLAIAACRRLGRKLVVTGQGPDTAKLRQMGGEDVQFIGHCSFSELKRYYAECRAFLMPGEEDFGIAPVEAMASGRPVIALASGGALDTVVPGLSGVLYKGTDADSLAQAILQFEAVEDSFNPHAIREHAQQFSRAVFMERFSRTVNRALEADLHAAQFSPAV